VAGWTTLRAGDRVIAQLTTVCVCVAGWTALRAGDRVIAQLLTEMDGINPAKNVFIIGATNRSIYTCMLLT